MQAVLQVPSTPPPAPLSRAPIDCVETLDSPGPLAKKENVETVTLGVSTWQVGPLRRDLFIFIIPRAKALASRGVSETTMPRVWQRG